MPKLSSPLSRVTRAFLSLLPVLLAACDFKVPDEPFAERFHKSLTESSGLARSPARPDIWFTHNDSGGKPRVFSFSLTSEAVNRHRVKGADAKDWEDIAAGTCPEGDGHCLYIADIGDNAEQRKRVRIYAATVPETEGTSKVVAQWHVAYEEGPQNAEALLVHPVTRELTIVTKSSNGRSAVYRVPPEPGKVTAIRVAELQFEGDEEGDRLVTGGDWSPDGSRVVLRTYNAAYEWVVDRGALDAHWQRSPRRVPLPVEQQGEAITYLPDGRLLTSSEGQPMPLNITDHQNY